jgi:hypothetical protein
MNLVPMDDRTWVLSTNTERTAADVALQFKRLWMVEQWFRSCKSLLETRPIFHHVDARFGPSDLRALARKSYYIDSSVSIILCCQGILVSPVKLRSDSLKSEYTYQWE